MSETDPKQPGESDGLNVYVFVDRFTDGLVRGAELIVLSAAFNYAFDHSEGPVTRIALGAIACSLYLAACVYLGFRPAHLIAIRVTKLGGERWGRLISFVSLLVIAACAIVTGVVVLAISETLASFSYR